MSSYILPTLLISTTILCASLCSDHAHNDSGYSWDKDDVTEDRTGRLFALYTVATDPCNGPDSTVTSGVCYPTALCERRGGKSLGPGSCGRFSTCCEYTFSSPQNGATVVVQEKLATIEASTNTTRNVFDVRRIDGYCQLKLEFLEFDFAKPKPNGTCEEDSLRFSNTVTVRNFILCGTKPDRPIGALCLQQYDLGTGMVKSFGFGDYLINPQEYNVCIGNNNAGTKTISETCPKPNAPGAVSSFFLTPFFGDDGSRNGILGEGYGDATCEKTSYVKIPNGDKYCGGNFRRAVSAGPSNILTVSLRADDAGRFGPNAYATLRFSFSEPPTPTENSCKDELVDAERTIFDTCKAYPKWDLKYPFMCICKDVARGKTKKRTGFCLKYSA